MGDFSPSHLNEHVYQVSFLLQGMLCFSFNMRKLWGRVKGRFLGRIILFRFPLWLDCMVHLSLNFPFSYSYCIIIYFIWNIFLRIFLSFLWKMDELMCKSFWLSIISHSWALTDIWAWRSKLYHNSYTTQVKLLSPLSSPLTCKLDFCEA